MTRRTSLHRGGEEHQIHLGMDPVFDILDADHDRFVVEDSNTRLSLAIEGFKEAESTVLLFAGT